MQACEQQQEQQQEPINFDCRPDRLSALASWTCCALSSPEGPTFSQLILPNNLIADLGPLILGSIFTIMCGNS
jgi:hypothetical protein